MSADLFYIKNHTATSTTRGDVSTLTGDTSRPTKCNKKAFKDWCASKNTDHVFYSGFEGSDPGLRISKTNPPVRMHAVVADYDDGDISRELLETLPDRCAPGLLPRYITKTWTKGQYRLIWTFEEPVWTTEPKLLKKLMGVIKKELKLSLLLPGLDEASLTPNMYWELGTGWAGYIDSQPVPANLVGLWVFDATKGLKLSLAASEDGKNIPVEDIQEEVEARWPGRWTGTFEIGSRGPLFWIADGIDRVGCQIAEGGVVCYSTRAPKSFMSWADILGRKWVEKYESERLGAVASTLTFDGRRYWTKVTEDSDWVGMERQDAILHLRANGLSSKVEGKETVSEAERVLYLTQTTRRVDGAIPIPGDKRERVTINGEDFLNISKLEPCHPADDGDEENWPWLKAFFEEIFRDNQLQRKVFLAWLKRFYESIYRGYPASGHAVVLAGPASTGKTLLNRFILGHMVGGWTDGSDYLLGKTQYNKQAAEVPLWCIDDSVSTEDYRSHRKFSETIKKHVANPQVLYHPKFANAFVVPWRGRIVITCNDDPESLSIVPSVDGTIKDKLILLRLNPEAKVSFPPSYELEPMIKAELPYFCRWLLDMEYPPEVLDGNYRFGVIAYHHPALEQEAHEADPHARFPELLSEWWRARKDLGASPTWEGTSTTLLNEMCQSEGIWTVAKAWNPVKVGRALAKIRARGGLTGNLKYESSTKDGYTVHMFWETGNPKPDKASQE